MRARKPLKVETVKDEKSGRSIDIVMVWESKAFRVDPMDGREVFEHAEHVVVRKKALELLKTGFEFKWRSVIRIDVADYVGHGEERGDTRAGAGLSFERREVALKADGKTEVDRPHELDVVEDWDRKAREDGTDRHQHSWRHSWDVELPYDQGAWDGLVMLARIINGAHEKLLALAKLDAAKMVRELASKAGPPLLAAPPAKKGRRAEA